jgi:hypothetical protein
MTSKFEVQAHGKQTLTFRDFEDAERYAEALVTTGEVEQADLHRLVERMNIPGALPKLVTQITRLDIYLIENDRLVRKQCNIF